MAREDGGVGLSWGRWDRDPEGRGNLFELREGLLEGEGGADGRGGGRGRVYMVMARVGRIS